MQGDCSRLVDALSTFPRGFLLVGASPDDAVRLSMDISACSRVQGRALRLPHPSVTAAGLVGLKARPIVAGKHKSELQLASSYPVGPRQLPGFLFLDELEDFGHAAITRLAHAQYTEPLLDAIVIGRTVSAKKDRRDKARAHAASLGLPLLSAYPQPRAKPQPGGAPPRAQTRRRRSVRRLFGDLTR